jgi:signal transduction histidine kinase/ligand-binding sensor domain-containing protein/DNA-binding response OmpR family regulator
MKGLLGLVLYIYLAVIPTWAVDFKYIQPKDGLISGEINHIVQDFEGRIWIATWSGLVCYDGYSFVNYRPILGDNNSLPDKKVKKLLVDSSGNLWIATEKNLVRFNRLSNSFETFRFNRDSNKPINILYLNELDKNIVIHTVEGFYRVPIHQKPGNDYLIERLLVFSNSQQEQYYYHYSISHKNLLYCASNEYDHYYARIFNMHFHFDGNDTTLLVDYTGRINETVNSISSSTDNGKLYFSTNNGVMVFDHATKRFADHLFKMQVITSALHAPDSKVYAAGPDVSLYYYDCTNGRYDSFLANPNRLGTILNSSILNLFSDFSGNLWIGHRGQGISVLNLNRKAFHTVRHDPFDQKSLNSNSVMCFNGSNDFLLVGLRSEGLNIAKLNNTSPEKLSFERIGEGIIHGVWDIAKKNDTIYWVGHSNGLCKLTYTQNRWKLEPFGKSNSINLTLRKVIIDKNHNLWCGSMKDGLLFIPNPDINPQQMFYKYSFDRRDSLALSDNVVTDILIDSSSRLWVATGNGLNLLKQNPYEINQNPENKPMLEFKHILGLSPSGKSLNNNEINCLKENETGTIWIATQGGGINIYDTRTGIFSYLTKNQGLAGNDILGMIQVDKNHWWVSTEKGLSHLILKPDSSSIKNYNAADGLQSDVFLINSYYKDADGRLFFGGENGFTAFYPQNIFPNNIPPRVVLNDIKISEKICQVGDTIAGKCVINKVLNETNQLELPFSANSFSIGVSAIHYQLPENNLIAYKLNDYHDRWHFMPSNQQYISFTRLPAGKYTLNVYAISADNVPSEEIKSLNILILPPWYKSTFMIALYLVFSMSAITIGAMLVFNRQKQRYLKQIYEMTLRNNESKMLFLANIAHELKTPVNLIVSPIEDMIINKSELGKKWHNHLYLMHRNARYVMKLINQIIDFRKMDDGKLNIDLHPVDLITLIKEVSLNFKAFEQQNNIKLHLHVPDSTMYVKVDPQKMEEVLYNLLSNAFKHTPANKEIEISLKLIEAQNQSENASILISVFNEGSSLVKGEEELIFERFFKSNNKIEGAGIGLSFAKSLVEMHHGKIWAQNIDGKGVMFSVQIPYFKAEVHDIIIDDNKFDAPEILNRSALFKYDIGHSVSELDKKSTKVLIVEDNNDLRSYMVELLSRFYLCYEASNGEQALQIVFDIVPDIIITDIVMPKMDGYELVKKVKEEIRTCHIPIIMLTAKNTNDNMIAGFKTGVDAYVIKPFETSVILSQIAQLVHNRKLIHQKYMQQNFMVEVSTQNLTRDDVFLKKVKKLLDKNIENPDFNVKELAGDLSMSTTQLYRKIKSLTNYSPVEFLRITRLHKAHDLLIQKNYSIKEVSFLTGFNNISYFVKCFREYFGVTPANFRDKMWPVE